LTDSGIWRNRRSGLGQWDAFAPNRSIERNKSHALFVARDVGTILLIAGIVAARMILERLFPNALAVIKAIFSILEIFL